MIQGWMFHSNGPVTEGVPADITANRETNPQGVIMQTSSVQFDLFKPVKISREFDAGWFIASISKHNWIWKKFQSTLILVPGFQQKVRSDYTETPLQSTHDHNGAFNSQDPESSVASG